MIWIIPQSLTSASALATAASTSDCIAASRICEQSLMRRSKRSRASCYLREWKAGRLTRLRSGLMSGLSRGNNFASAWISSQAAIRASRSQAPGSDSAEKTLATYGPTSQMEFQFCDPGSASLKTSKDTLASDSERSSSTWASLVTRRRGEYSARLRSARLTNASGSSSWPTVTANEDSYRIGGNSQQSKCLSAMARRGEMSGPVAPAIPSSDGSRPASWATPEAKNQVGYQVWQDGTKWPKLGSQVQAWATPRPPNGGQTTSGAKDKQSKRQVLLQHQTGGKLNPRWVETLMGLPVGWTMPSCASPVIPESMSYASSETASSPQLPSELSASS